MIIKNFNSCIKYVKPTKKELEKEFQNDNYLIHTIKRTTKIQRDKKLIEVQEKLNDIMDIIHKEIKLTNNPKTKLIHEKNNEFSKKYKYLSNKFEAEIKKVLEELIIKYINRGYHIPKFSDRNNIFKLDPLIEENTEKIKFMLMEDLNNKNNISGLKSLMFLNKLNYFVKKRTTNNVNVINHYYQILKQNEAYIKELSLEKLKEDIENLINLVKMVKIKKIGSVQPKRKSSYLLQNPKFLGLRLSYSINSDKEELTQINLDSVNKADKNNYNNTSLNKEENINTFIKRKRKSFLSMRLNKNAIEQQKFIDSMISKNQTESSQHTENNNDNEKKIVLKKSNPIFKLKSDSFLTNENINNIRKKNEINFGKINNFESYTNKKTYSNIGKYMKKTKKNKYNKFTKKKLLLGLKKICDNTKINEILSKKESEKFLENSFDNSKKKYFFKIKLSREKNDNSRNINILSKRIKRGETQGLEEKKSQFLEKTYMKLKKGQYNSVEDLTHKYLKDIKKIDSNEEKDLMNHYNYKNFRNNLIELNMKVGDDSIRKKIEKIYCNNYLLKRITNSLDIMKEKEKNMNRLEKIYTSGVIKNS